jgi:hypothetical protein
MQKLLTPLLFVLFFNAPALAGSVENVFRSISILANIGEVLYTMEKTETFTSTTAQFDSLASQYKLAYKIGNNYKTREIKKKLGRKFLKEWKKNMKAVKIISGYYTKIQKLKSGQTLSNKEISKSASAMRAIEDFRLFYIKWRQ